MLLPSITLAGGIADRLWMSSPCLKNHSFPHLRPSTLSNPSGWSDAIPPLRQGELVKIYSDLIVPPDRQTSTWCKNKLICYPQQLGRSWKVFGHLPRNPPEPHQPSAPEPSGTPSAIGTRTLRNLLRNLVLQLHRIAPELFWAKDPVASFAVGEKVTVCYSKPSSGSQNLQ